MRDNEYLMNLAARAAVAAAEYIAATDRPAVDSWHHKGHGDFATEVDRKSELIIGSILLEAEPDSIVIGEELSPEENSSGLTWIVDPLDGTANFLHGLPVYAVSIAAAVEGEVVAGVVQDVCRNRCYGSYRGGGAWVDGERMRVSITSKPELALIGTGFPFKAIGRLDLYTSQFARILKATSGIRRAGAAAIDLAFLAEGIFDGFWELLLAPWDVAAGTLLVREAGGIITDLEGSDKVLKHGSILGGNPAIHEWMLRFLSDNPIQPDG